MSSISRRLLLWLAIPLLLVALCGAMVHYLSNLAPGVINSDHRLREASNSIMQRIVVKEGQVTLNMESGAGLPPPPGEALTFNLRDALGHLILGNSRLLAAPMISEASQMYSYSPIDQRNLRTLATRFDTPAGVVVITVADLSPMSERAARLGLLNTLLWDFVQLDVTLILVWLGVHFGLRPIKRLRDEIALRSPLDLRPIGEGGLPREIAPVVVTLNRLFQTLRASAQSHQQFIANTAHQLRTPITGMQAQLDVLIAEPVAAPIKDRLMTMQLAVKHLSHSANQLLTLARADPVANIATKSQAVDLQSLASEAAARFFDRALQSNIDLGVDAQPATVSADPSLIDDLVSNLLDNALKYTPAGGSVTVTTGSRDGLPFVAVEDTGPGIPESERQQVTRRFYRLPNSPGHGSGLGLAIVDEIARLYGGRLDIAAGSGGHGTRVEVLFG